MHVDVLDRLSATQFAFPAPFLQAALTITHSGATVDGEPSAVWSMSPASYSERY